MTFRAFYSDPHFGHANIIAHCERPFADLLEMHAEMVRRYNAVVGPNDWCLWLGDVSMYMGVHELSDLLAQMNGTKALVIGNHDRSKSWATRLGFAFVVDSLEMRIAGRRVLASHYPYAGATRRHGEVDRRYPERRPQRQKGRMLMHGHSHSPNRVMPGDRTMIHVGVDAWDYAPAPIEAVAELLRQAPGDGYE